MAQPDNRSVLLAGATGLVGRALLARLMRPGRAVDLLVRRPVDGLPPGARVHVVDFAGLPDPLPAADDVFIALGTTIKAAGSRSAFRAVDLDAVVATARSARAAGATRLGVVSAHGADRNSRLFYNRVKGEMEEAVCALGFKSVVMARPSLLLGDRAALGQPERPGEVWAARLLGPAIRLVPRAVRPIAATDVAAALIAAVEEGRPGARVLPSAAMLGADAG